jgi:uncharacterized protein YdhG (YjbR/CyaY superfamily)
MRGVISKTIDEYLAGIPEPARTTMSKVRAAVRAAAPKEAVETISYGMPMYKYKGMLIGFCAFKAHCSVFPTSLRVMEQFAEELKRYDTSKGTIRFPLDKPLPAALIRKLVKAKALENELKKSR